MGGVVVAKFLCMAKARKEYEAIVTCTMGCAFFGAPFKGSEMAKVALLYSSVFGNDAYESLLSFMRTETNDTLDEVVSDFMEIREKLVPKIELFCAYEEVPTDVAYAERMVNSPKMSSLTQHKFFRAGAKKLMEVGFSGLPGTHFVTKESAVLPGAHTIGLTVGHADLIRFESITSEKFVPVKMALTSMVQTARINARKRTSGQNLLSHKFVNQVRRSLEGVDMRQKFRAKVEQRQTTSWLTSEPQYQEWMAIGDSAKPLRYPHMWLKGGPGLGKTNASLAAIHTIGQTQLREQQTESAGKNETFLAYFLCERSSGYDTAEDVLKNLITQLIDQEESLAQHARWFVPNPGYRGAASDDSSRGDLDTPASGAKATATVDNLWQCLQDMIEDPIVSSIHVIISNFHLLDSSESTTALLVKLREDAFSTVATPHVNHRARWLITSRDDQHIRSHLTAKCIAVIDLENDREYGGKVKIARQKHAKDTVTKLRHTKKYSSDLASYIRNSIESQSADEKWIDVLCLLLGAMPNNSSSLTIRKWLREMGRYSINKLVDHARDTILSRNEDLTLEIDELLQTLTIAYEPPTLADLAVLTEIEDIQQLTELVRKCSPVLQIGEVSEDRNKVIFGHPEFRDHLVTLYHGESEQRKRYHGSMAWRCFKYIEKSYGHGRNGDAKGMRSSALTERIIDDSNVLVMANEDEEPDDAGTRGHASALSRTYPIKYLYRHLSEGFPDVARELFDDDRDFWGRDESIRSEWLRDFQTLTTDLRDLNTSGMSALHVAAAIGANELVTVLIDKNGQAALSWTNGDGMTALHVAANNNHLDVVDTLIKAGADIEAGEGDVGTALHCAALLGNCAIMAFLIEKGANVNALGRDIGPVINAAIRSGTVDAVKQIMDRDVRFDLDYTRCDPPLSLAARIPESSLFQQILETGRDKWLQNVKLLDQALISASYSGRLESVRILLKFPQVYTDNTVESSIRIAATERNWATANELLDYIIDDTTRDERRDVKLTEVFYLAATSRGERLDLLEKIWTFTNRTITQDVLDISLYQATVLNRDTTVVWLLENCGASANATADRPGWLALDWAEFSSSADFWNALNAAASIGNAFLVRTLISKGAEIDGDRDYALQLAASEGHAEVVKILLESGAAIDKELTSNDELGFFSGTALQAACDRSRERVVEVLLTHGADPNLGGGVLTNPITAATQRAQPEILRLLLKASEINVNVKGGEDGSTPLINAATHMSTEFVELLVRKGADINAANLAGDTALIMAAWKGDKGCVEMLCDAGADVTYRSHRGLATQVAAENLHPECAHVLAEKTGGTIDAYREKVADALATLKERDRTNEGLEAMLAETQEQLQIANKDIVFRELEKARLKSFEAIQGQTYQSIGEQMKAIRAERAELLKQLDVSKGQNELITDTVIHVQALLDEERQTNAALRKRQGYATLQDEMRAAVEASEQAKRDTLETIQIEEHKRGELQHEIEALQNTVKAAQDQVASAETATMVALGVATAERNEKAHIQSQLEDSQNSAQELRDVLASIQLAALKTPSEHHEVRAAGPAGQDYFRHHSVPGNIHSGENGSSGATGSPILASPGGMVMTPGSPPTSPYSPGGTPSGGFRTVHGQHRADGSFGGYRTERRGMRRTKTDSLYDLSVKGESGEEAASVRSDGHSSSTTMG
ncbi:hypothetical protein LTS16_013164 [Friedmanniomyces endolithicus]|nr:hypothetical protein LTS16_013164 [Friedmanniomyces endolithicus]